jgi:hypothetical protein
MAAFAAEPDRPSPRRYPRHSLGVGPSTPFGAGRRGARSPRPAPRPTGGPRAFTTFWEFAIAVNRSDPAALTLAVTAPHRTFPWTEAS